jgi:hypothetical protein
MMNKARAKKNTNKVGMRFGRLIALEKLGKFYSCLCDCGKIKNIYTSSLGKNTRSCGCLNSEVASVNLKSFRDKVVKYELQPGYKFGHIHYRNGKKLESKTYITWSGLRKIYLGRYDLISCRPEISVCERWAKFENFLEDMGEKPPYTRLARYNKDDDYYKENCHWKAVDVKGKKVSGEGIRK